MRAGIVGSGASMVGGWPRSCRVWEVMGPIEARVMPGGRVRFGGIEECDEVAGGGGAGEGDGVWVVGWGGEELLEGRDGVGGRLVAVGVGDGEMGSSGGEGFGEDVAGLFGSDEEHVGAWGVGCEGFGKGFGYVFLGE